MPTVYLAPTVGNNYQAFTTGGLPLNAGLLYTYAAGGTTPQATYTTSAGSVQNANPIVLGADGRPPNEVWLLDAAYRFDLKDSAGNLIQTYDNVYGIQEPLADSAGSSLVGYINTGTGATARTVQARLRDINSVKDWGAVGNGSTDDTAAIQAAITALQGGRSQLYFPAGTYKVTSTLTISGGLRIFGAARSSTAIAWTSTTLDVISILSSTEVVFESITFSGPAAATAGSIITLSASSGANSFSIFRDCTFVQGYDQLTTVKAYAWIVDDCYFTGSVRRGITVQNTNDVDAGDSKIVNSTFSNLGAAATGVYWLSSGGTRIINNKFLDGLYGFRLNIASAAVTSDILIVGNSFENMTTAALDFVTQGGGASIANIQIQNNQIMNTPRGVSMGDSTAFMSRIAVTGNIITLSSSGTYGVLLTNVSDFYVGENVITGTGGTPSGITVGASSTKGQIGPNKYTALTTQSTVDNTGTTVAQAGPTLLKANGATTSCPADTSEDALATITIPAKQMGANGYLRIKAAFSCTSSGNNKTFRVRWSTISGTAFYDSGAQTTITGLTLDLIIANTGATNSNRCTGIAQTSGGALAVAPVLGAIDTTADTTLIITGQKASAGETLSIIGYTVEMVTNG